MVMEYVSSLKAAWELAKAVKASTDAIDDAQIKLQVADLISALAEAKIQAAESSELIASLQKQLKSKLELKFNGSVYYRETEDGKNQDGPWCPTCKDARGLEIRLQKSSDPRAAWGCRECKGWFQ